MTITTKLNFIVICIVAVTAIMTVSIGEIHAQENNKIPEWFKSTASWWVQGLITDDEFSKALTDLIDNEIIVIEGYGKIDMPIEEIENMILSVDTDKESYSSNEDVIISGTIPNGNTGVVNIHMYDGIGIHVAGLNANMNDGKYQITFPLIADWYNEGEWTIHARYWDNKITTNFNYLK